MTLRHVTEETTLGPLTIVADGDAVIGLYYPHHARRPALDSFGPRVSPAADAVLRDALDQLNEYLAGDRADFDVPFDLRGSVFERRVWDILQTIPYGQTMTYGAIAAQLGNKGLARRVGQAVGANPVSIFVPCHRVVGANGSLTGYAGGIDRKRALLDLEESPHPTRPGGTHPATETTELPAR